MHEDAACRVRAVAVPRSLPFRLPLGLLSRLPLSLSFCLPPSQPAALCPNRPPISSTICLASASLRVAPKRTVPEP